MSLQINSHSVHTTNMEETEIWCKKVMKPNVVLGFNDKIGGVDSADQSIAMYLISRKQGKKYYLMK